MYTRFIYLFTLLLYCKCNLGQSTTKSEFINNVIVEDTMYKKDSIQLLSILKDNLRKHEASFYNKEYFDSSKVFIDTILYNEEKNKIASFIITKNPTSKQLSPDTNHDFYYDAFCYLGKKNETTDQWDLRWFRVFNLTNYTDLKETSDRIKWKYFNELSVLKDADDKPLYGYNLNDKRFWESHAWSKFFR